MNLSADNVSTNYIELAFARGSTLLYVGYRRKKYVLKNHSTYLHSKFT